MTAPSTDSRPNGPVAAAFLAAGVGSAVLGLMVVLAAFSDDVNNFLKFDESFGLGSGVGPLSGKTAVAVLAYAIAWIVLHLALRGRDVNFRRAFVWSLALVGVGFLGTFPPFFTLFH
jgi:hypothetical protein